MRISRLKLQNWKNFRSIDVILPLRIFLVGPNASGKSNFLDALRFLHDIADPAGGFQKACDDRGGISKMRCLAARQNPQIGIAVEISEGDTLLWKYEIQFSQQVRGYRLPQLTYEAVYKGETCLLERPDAQDNDDEMRLTQTALEQINFNKEFREIQQFFAKILYLHLVPQLIREGLALGSQSPFTEAYGQNFLERVAQTTPRSRKARLRRIREALVVAVPQLEDLSLETDEVGQPHLVGKYQHWRPYGAKQDETQFSDGTLRLIGLLWALQEGDGPLLLEEPELSLHSAIVKRLARLISRVQKKTRNQRQVYISTHSAELLSDRGIGGEEILLLEPSEEGTQIKIASDVTEVKALLAAGMQPSDVVIPYTEPENAQQLVLPHFDL